MKDVFLDPSTNTISFTYVKGKNVCIGETDSSLEDFLEWMKIDYIARELDLSGLPTIEATNS